MKKLGIIGGLGPMATTYFLYLLTRMSKAESDQEHMELLMHSKPSIPDRTRYILGLSQDDPAVEMAEIGRELKAMGAELLAIPCITAHYFHEELEKSTGLQVLHAVRETAEYLRQAGVEKVGILATDGTVKSGLFDGVFRSYGIATVNPGEESQRIVMDLIYGQIKSGEKGNLEEFIRVGEELCAEGAQVNLLGCTELSLLKRDYTLPAGYLDVLEVLAKCAVQECGRFDPQYQDLITR
ncbi:MAG: amino acid racemase [Firmicutes bacterium]|nr:amino acid racemase [Bacillota bacterium]